MGNSESKSGCGVNTDIFFNLKPSAKERRLDFRGVKYATRNDYIEKTLICVSQELGKFLGRQIYERMFVEVFSIKNSLIVENEPVGGGVGSWGVYHETMLIKFPDIAGMKCNKKNFCTCFLAIDIQPKTKDQGENRMQFYYKDPVGAKTIIRCHTEGNRPLISVYDICKFCINWINKHPKYDAVFGDSNCQHFAGDFRKNFGMPFSSIEFPPLSKAEIQDLSCVGGVERQCNYLL